MEFHYNKLVYTLVKLARYGIACTKFVHALFFSRPNRAIKLAVV